MAINQNHTTEELNGVKSAIVEKQVSAERAAFLKKILEYNGYQVIVVPAPPPKAAAAAKPAAIAAETVSDLPEPAAVVESFIVGVTDLVFNPVNAIFGRLLKLPGGHVVTLAYWQQKDQESHDEVPYFNQAN